MMVWDVVKLSPDMVLILPAGRWACGEAQGVSSQPGLHGAAHRCASRQVGLSAVRMLVHLLEKVTFNILQVLQENKSPKG